MQNESQHLEPGPDNLKPSEGISSQGQPNAKEAAEIMARLALAAREELLTLSEVAAILKVSRTTVWRRCNLRKNPLPISDLGGIPRVKRGALMDWIKSNKQ
jgi:hypothetical protein